MRMGGSEDPLPCPAPEGEGGRCVTQRVLSHTGFAGVSGARCVGMPGQVRGLESAGPDEYIRGRRLDVRQECLTYREGLEWENAVYEDAGDRQRLHLCQRLCRESR